MNARLSALLAKYDVAVPRYTSYPAVPHWRDVPDGSAWLEAVDTALAAASASLAVYVQAVLIFAGKAVVYLRAMNKPIPASVEDWIW